MQTVTLRKTVHFTVLMVLVVAVAVTFALFALYKITKP